MGLLCRVKAEKPELKHGQDPPHLGEREGARLKHPLLMVKTEILINLGFVK